MPHYGNYDPSTFGWAPNADIEAYSFRGIPFPQGVARRAKPIFDGLLADLIAGGLQIPHTGNVMVDGNWGYTYRPVRGGTSLSFHAYGLAIDIDAPHNPQHAAGLGTMPADASARAHKWGCEWGGDWSTADRDRMHFECHLTPAEIPKVLARNGATHQADTSTGPTTDWSDDVTEQEFTRALSSALSPLVAALNKLDGKLDEAIGNKGHTEQSENLISTFAARMRDEKWDDTYATIAGFIGKAAKPSEPAEAAK